MNQSLMICKHTYWSAGMAKPGGLEGRGRMSPLILVDQLTLSEPRGQIMPTKFLLPPPLLQIFRPSSIPVLYSKINKHKKKSLYLHLPNI